MVMLEEKNVQPVVVTDIHMSFGSMVIFMVKWAIAAIPAFIILLAITLAALMMFGGFLLPFSRDKKADFTPAADRGLLYEEFLSSPGNTV